MTSIVISAGHGLYVRGASSDMLDEVDEARRVTTQLSEELKDRGIQVKAYWDDVSRTQQENLERIVDYHNAQERDLDISVHFNAFEQTPQPRGTEVYYGSPKKLAAALSAAIADVGFIDRGAKSGSGLYFISHTTAPAVLLEICFVDSEADCDIYKTNFDLICESIANVLGGEDIEIEPEPPEALFYAKGSCSYFGGPDDLGVDADEGLALAQSMDDAPQLFLPYQPEDTTGLARRLNPYTHYLAARWDYNVTPKQTLLQHTALVRATKTGIALKAFPIDWGPHQDTGRVADLSLSLLEDLGIDTDDEVEVTFPYREE